MTVRYWVATGGVGFANASVAGNWNNSADGTGSAVLPTNTDTIVFGDAATFAANKGYAPCNWNIASLTLAEIVALNEYGYSVDLNTSKVTFDVDGSSVDTITLTGGEGWADAGFSVGMGLVVSGSALNDGLYSITAISTNVATVSQAVQDEVINGNLTVGFSSEGRSIQMSENVTTAGLRLGCPISAPAARVISFAGAAPSSGFGSKDYLDRYILNDSNAEIRNIANLTYSIDASTGWSITTRCHFDDGPHPIITSSTESYFSPEYVAPTYTGFGATTMLKLQITNAASSMAPKATVTSQAANDSKKTFYITHGSASQLSYAPALWNAGLSTWGFADGGAGGFEIPVTGTDTAAYGGGTGFTAYWHGVEALSSGVAGGLILIAAGKKLYCNNLTIGSGVNFKGSVPGNANSETIICVRKPTIYGTWNYQQVAEGVYVSNPKILSEFYANLNVNNLTVNEVVTAPLHVQYAGTGDGFILESTDVGTSLAPDLVLWRNSGSPAVGDDIGNILFDGENDGGTRITYARIQGEIDQMAASSAAGRLEFDVLNNGTHRSFIRCLGEDTGQPKVKINEDAQNIDFVVEGTGEANLLYTDASTDRVGVGTATPSTSLEIQDGLTTTGAVLTLSTKEPSVVDNDVLGRINFQAPLDTGADSDLVAGSIHAEATATFSDTVNATDLVFSTGASETATEKMRLDSVGNLGLGETTPTFASGGGLHIQNGTQANLRLEDDSTEYFDVAMQQGNAYLINRVSDGTIQLWTNGSERMRITHDSKVGIGTNTPMNILQVGHAGADGDDGVMIVRADTTTADGDLLGGIGFDSTDGNVPSSIKEASAFITSYATEDHATTDKGGNLKLGVTVVNTYDDTVSTTLATVGPPDTMTASAGSNITTYAGIAGRATMVVLAASTTYTATTADTGIVIVLTVSTSKFVLPDIPAATPSTIGTQFTVINNSGGTIADGITTGDTSNAQVNGAVPSSGQVSIADNVSYTFIQYAADKWQKIG